MTVARIRTLKPEFWNDEKLAPLAPIDRLVFIGLISQADDAGRLVDSIRLIDGLLFGATGDTCAQSLQTLAELWIIQRGKTASGQAVIQITNWEKHQRVERPNMKNVLPPIKNSPKRRRRTVGDESVNDSVKDHRSVGDAAEQLSAHTFDLRPTTYDHHTNDLRPSTTAAAAAFEQFWKKYPKRAGDNPRKRAEKAWSARLKEGALPADILAGEDRYIAFCNATGKVGTETVLHAATFVGPDKRWEADWIPPPGPAPGSQASRITNEYPGKGRHGSNGFTQIGELSPDRSKYWNEDRKRWVPV